MSRGKIAFIIDSKGWAFDNIAQNIKSKMTEFDVDIIPGEIFEGNMIRLFLCCKDYDAIHFFWRGYISLIDRPAMKDYAWSLGINFDEFCDKYIFNKVITFGVCDELYLTGDEKWRTEEIFKYSKGYIVTSKKLYEIYSKFEKKPYAIIHDGVNTKEYKPIDSKKFEKLDRKLIVGWVGNSKFVDSDGDIDMKGVEGIIKPAIEELQREGYNIELKLADRNIKKIEQSKMPDYYNSIDLYVCASKTEGTPLTILESMSTGIPVISTNVGIVSEAFGKKQQNFILEERSVKCLINKIKEIMDNPSYMKELSEENLKQIKSFDWENIAADYTKFFKYFINNI